MLLRNRILMMAAWAWSAITEFTARIFTIESAKTGQFDSVSLKGRTIKNILAKDGQFDNFDGWEQVNFGGAFFSELSQDYSLFGSNSLRQKDGDNSRLYKEIDFKVGHKYFISRYEYQIDEAIGTNLRAFRLIKSDTKEFKSTNITSKTSQDKKGEWDRLSDIFEFTQSDKDLGYDAIFFRHYITNWIEIRHDGFMLIDLTDIGETETDVGALEAKYPYFNGTANTLPTLIKSENEAETEKSEVFLPEVGRSLPNGVADEVGQVGGEWERVQRVSEEVVFDGSGSWTRREDIDENYVNTYVFQTNISDAASTSIRTNWLPLMSSTGDTERSRLVLFSGTLIMQIFVNRDRLISSSVDSFKTWLSDNNIIINYQLETPIETTADVKIFENSAQAQALRSYGNNTTVSQKPIVYAEETPDGSNQITLDTTYGLVELVACYMWSGAEWVDKLDDASIDLETGVVTITGADLTKDYYVAATVDTSNSTVGTFSARYPI